MNARFMARMARYLDRGVEDLGGGGGEEERGEKGGMVGKRKRDCGDEGEETEEGEKEEKEKEKGKEVPLRKLTVKLKLVRCGVERGDGDGDGTSSSSCTFSQQQQQQQQRPGPSGQPKPSKQVQTTTSKLPALKTKPKSLAKTNADSPPKMLTRQSTRNLAPLSTMPTGPPKQKPARTPYFPHLHVTNEPPIPWHPIPLPCPYLPDDYEGPRAAWKRLFPNEAEFGEYGGRPTGWMAKMTWKAEEGWVERGEGDVYVERFLG
ncbi:hypothetical protein COCMIDRAFT_35498 [Bipolaris oryzae ATCC 44560]|uniref:Uncharacterized protein n=1 Tax=Bipolaris oryzae ATCC 44560 TaxID=930090 RepID=W6ZA99_COCMI|nr:uncharacterized protein COCMIDRAFT_35498 [Bipolaris oryzae ATCC 44560]EUC46910.1 hypothetical protein COCMIDRAFT_35498 [Bipolaris oryzae ATCC 44560]